MKEIDVEKETRKCCKEVNKRIPCKTQEEIEECTIILDDYFSRNKKCHLFWSSKIWDDCGKDGKEAMQRLISSGEYKLYPSEDIVSHPGIFVKNKE